MLLNKKYRILFVCLANVCRSPMAEAILKERLKQLNLDKKVHVSSAAIEKWLVGKPPHRETLRMLKKNGISYGKMKSRQLKKSDAKRYNYIICMDHDIQQAAIKRLGPSFQDKIVLFSSFSNRTSDIVDPMKTKDFYTTFTEIERGMTDIVTTITSEIDH